jgi:hypothetical protein
MRFACGVVIALMLSGSGCSQQSAPLQKPSESQPENVSAPETVTAPAPTWPALPAADTPYLNANLETEYVGSAACTRCHASSAGTYHHTAMSVSMLPVDIEQEPPDGQYDHRLSSRRYTISRRDGQMWHTESKVIDGVTVLLSEYPVKYVVGSGRHSRSYLVEAEGFLVESPITWYSIRKEWGMSPGYDRQDHLGFERATGQGCLECHAGRTAPIDKSVVMVRVRSTSKSTAILILLRFRSPPPERISPSSIRPICRANLPRPFVSSVTCEVTQPLSRADTESLTSDRDCPYPNHDTISDWKPPTHP